MNATEGKVSLPDVAAQCGLTWHQAYNLTTKGKFGSPERIGNRWFVPEMGVRDFLAKQRERVKPGKA